MLKYKFVEALSTSFCSFSLLHLHLLLKMINQKNRCSWRESWKRDWLKIKYYEVLIVFLKCWSYFSFHRSSTINAFPTLKDKLSFHKSSSICHTRCFFLNWPCPENGRITVMKVTVWVQTLLLFVFSLFWKEFCYLQHFLGRGLIALLNWLLLLGFVNWQCS